MIDLSDGDFTLILLHGEEELLDLRRYFDTEINRLTLFGLPVAVEETPSSRSEAPSPTTAVVNGDAE